MNWQPISKKAPEGEDKEGCVPGYLCYLSKEATDEGCFPYKIGNGCWLNANGADQGVTHWMNLPAPPKDGE